MITLKHFSPQTDPGIDFAHASEDSLLKLDNAREIAGVPFPVSSSHRTDVQSVAVGGLNDDAHTEVPCSAYDIIYADHAHRARIIYGLVMAGFRRIGINKFNKHVHADDSPTLPKPAFWLEKEEDL